MKNNLSVKEFAEKVGCSTQAVYKRIKNGGLDDYILSENPTIISIEAVKLFNQPRKQPTKKKVEKLNDNSALIDELRNELNQYREREKHYQMQIEELTRSLHQEQALHLDTKKHIQMLNGTVEEVEPKEEKSFFQRLFKR